MYQGFEQRIVSCQNHLTPLAIFLHSVKDQRQLRQSIFNKITIKQELEPVQKINQEAKSKANKTRIHRPNSHAGLPLRAFALSYSCTGQFPRSFDHSFMCCGSLLRYQFFRDCLTDHLVLISFSVTSVTSLCFMFFGAVIKTKQFLVHICVYVLLSFFHS